MKKSLLPLRGLAFYWRTNLAVLLGMTVGTAVLAGSLIVGDSVRGSLKRMSLERLGKIDYALVAGRMFSEGLADKLSDSPDFDRSFASATPIVYIQGSIINAETRAAARRINILGVDERFWNLSPDESSPASGGSVPFAVNASLAEEIGVAEGDAVLVSVAKPDPIPAEAVHGRRTDNTVTQRFTVEAVIPSGGLGRFGLTPSQQLPRNVYVPLASLQRLLDRPGEVNALLVASAEGTDVLKTDDSPRLQEFLLRVADLKDLGLRLRVNASPQYLSVESERMVLRETDIKAIEAAADSLGIRSAQTLTYLANTIAIGEREMPYSTITALDPTLDAPFGPLELIDGSPVPELGERDILLNEWAAEDLRAEVGDSVSVSYYETGPVGQFQTNEARDFILRGIVAMSGAALDPGLTPEYPGIHDAQSVTDWDPPFPVDFSRVRDIDEDYWDEHKTTPKAFISLATGLRLWTSRFGRLTSIRLAAVPGESLERTAELLTEKLRLQISPEDAGLVFQPVKRRGLEASSGADIFGYLFIGFSLFIIVSAMLLVRLLFTLGVEQRSREIGLLLAAGYTARDVRRLFIAEGAVLALIGAALGLGLGLGYAALMLHGLRTWWIGSVGTTFLWLHVGPLSLAIGFFAGIAAGLWSVYWAVRHLSSAEPSRLIAGALTSASLLDPSAEVARSGRRATIIASACLAVAVLAILSSSFVSATTQTALFMVSGATLLVAALSYLSAILRHQPRTRTRPGSPWPIVRLGVRNASRHHARSVLTTALVASATFIIVTVAAMRHGAHSAAIEKSSGNGGFALLAEADSPIIADLNDAAGRDDLGFPPDEEGLFEGVRFFPMRLKPGEDASCLNLYRPQQPRILGASDAFIERGGFSFSSSLAETDDEKANAWKLLDGDDGNGVAPAIGDMNTVMWILRSGQGKDFSVEDDNGRPVTLRIAGLLSRSALQGELVISEKHFVRLFPERSGASFFLIEIPDETPDARIRKLQDTLEANLSSYGFDVIRTQDRIDSYLAVENTYLSTFQALGGLGLLLGTLGLAAVMLRNVLERRGELALLRSVGYRSSALAVLVLSENGFLLVLGLTIGAGAALLSVAPRLMQDVGAFPWASLSLTLLAVLITGLLAGGVAAVAALRSPLVESLRAP